ncbi:Serine/threonine-protein kinase Nek2 [Arthrobotrys megalospora]
MTGVLRQLDSRDTNYEVIEPLGLGGFGSVAKVRRVSDGKIMACKAIDCSRPGFEALATREISILSSASSEKYIATFSNDATFTRRTKTMRLYMKLYEGGDLQTVITRCKHEDSIVHPFMATYWAMEIARGLNACHDRGIIHRDLKPANNMPYVYNDILWRVTDGIALTEDQMGPAYQFSSWLQSRPPWCHISDFGVGKFSTAAFFSGHHTLGSIGIIGTPGFLAPEIIRHSPEFSIKTDVYSLGCLIYTLCTCLPPPPPGEQVPIIPSGSGHPDRLREIVAQCMHLDPEKRPNSRELANEIADAFMDIQDDDKFGRIREKLADALKLHEIVSTTTAYPPESVNGAPPPQWVLNKFLRQAIGSGNYQFIQGLLNAGADVNACAFDMMASKKNIWESVHAFSKNSPFHSVLKRIFFNGSKECVDTLLSRGAERYAVGLYPLSVAACCGFVDIIDLLVLKWNFEVNFTVTESVVGETPIASAALFGNPGAVKRLLELNASVRIPQEWGDYPLHDVFFIVRTMFGRDLDRVGERLECARMIYDAAPEIINFQDNLGFTPLHYAISAVPKAGSQFVQFLIDRGADPYIQDKKGRDAYHLYLKDGQEELVIMIADAYPAVKVALSRYRNPSEGTHNR